MAELLLLGTELLDWNQFESCGFHPWPELHMDMYRVRLMMILFHGFAEDAQYEWSELKPEPPMLLTARFNIDALILINIANRTEPAYSDDRRELAASLIISLGTLTLGQK